MRATAVVHQAVIAVLRRSEAWQANTAGPEPRTRQPCGLVRDFGDPITADHRQGPCSRRQILDAPDAAAQKLHEATAIEDTQSAAEDHRPGHDEHA